MSDVTTDKLELSSTQTRNWVLIGAIAFLMLLVQGVFTYFISSSTTEMRETNRNLVEVAAGLRVVQVQMTYIQQQVTDLQSAKKDAGQVHQTIDTRLNSIEQRLALHDQWMQAHTK